MIVVNPVSCPNGSFGIGRKDDRQPRSDVGFLLRPISRSVVGFTHRREEQVGLVRLALRRRSTALQIPLMRIHSRGNLLTLCLVRSLQKSMAKTEGQGQIGLDSPCVLQKVFKLVGLEVTADKRPIGKKRSARGARDHVVCACVTFSNISDDGRIHLVERCFVFPDGWKTKRSWIRLTLWAQIRGIGARSVKRVNVIRGVVLDHPPVAAHRH